jgi:hypothetical protein
VRETTDTLIGAAGVSANLYTAARRAFVVRAVTLPVAVVAGLLAARITVSTLGVDGYALFALVVGLAALNPIGDLGVQGSGHGVYSVVALSRLACMFVAGGVVFVPIVRYN